MKTVSFEKQTISKEEILSIFLESNGLLCLFSFERFSQWAGSFENWGISLITWVIISYVGHLDQSGASLNIR